MAVKIFSVLIIVFCVGVTLVMVGRVGLGEGVLDDIKLADAIAGEVVSYEINATGVGARFEADSGVRYDGYDLFEGFSGVVLRDGERHEISSKNAKIEDRNITLFGDAIYHNKTSGLKYKSDELSYKTDSGIISSDGDFTAIQGENVVSGKGIKYDTRTKKGSSGRIKGWFEVRDAN